MKFGSLLLFKHIYRHIREDQHISIQQNLDMVDRTLFDQFMIRYDTIFFII